MKSDYARNSRAVSSQSIYESIRGRITYLDLKPGEEININLLSEQLSVSRSPIRDALIRLQSEGLVDILPQRGSWVSLIDYQMVKEEMLLRELLELEALAHLPKEKEAYIKAMEYCIALQKEAKENSDAVSYYEADDKLHSVYFEAAGYSRFWQIILRETGNYRRLRMLSFFYEGIAGLNIRQHEKLIESIKKGSFEDSRNIIKSHITKLDTEKNKIIEKWPEYFCKGEENETY